MPKHNPTTSRRALLGAAIALPAAAATIATIARAEADAGQDAEIIAAWERRNAAERENYATDWGDTPADAEDARYQAITDRLDEAETFIQHASPKTKKGVEIQLWLAFAHHDAGGVERINAIDLANGNVDAIFARLGDIDFDAQMILRAIMALRGMGA